jgi:hypothetical protein
MTIKTLEALEGYSFIIISMAAAAYLFDDHQSAVNVAIRLGSIFMSWVRTMFHGHLLNAMDDAHYIPPVKHSSSQIDDEPADPEVIGEHYDVVALTQRSR